MGEWVFLRAAPPAPLLSCRMCISPRETCGGTPIPAPVQDNPVTLIFCCQNQEWPNREISGLKFDDDGKWCPCSFNPPRREGVKRCRWPLKAVRETRLETKPTKWSEAIKETDKTCDGVASEDYLIAPDSWGQVEMHFLLLVLSKAF